MNRFDWTDPLPIRRMMNRKTANGQMAAQLARALVRDHMITDSAAH